MITSSRYSDISFPLVRETMILSPIVADNSSLCITLVRGKQGAALTYNVGLFFILVHKPVFI